MRGAAARQGHFADLSGLARIRWNTKMSGYHQIRPIVKLADGNVYVGDQADGSTRDWIVSEISFADLKWLKVGSGPRRHHRQHRRQVDLSKVDEVGFIDLMPGSGHGAGGWVDVAESRGLRQQGARKQDTRNDRARTCGSEAAASGQAPVDAVTQSRSAAGHRETRGPSARRTGCSAPRSAPSRNCCPSYHRFASGSGAKKLGHPVPLSNLRSATNSG
jgi:hypothetical protein